MILANYKSSQYENWIAHRNARSESNTSIVDGVSENEENEQSYMRRSVKSQMQSIVPSDVVACISKQ